MYGVIKAHKPEKNYPMRIVVSTIGTPSYRTSEYLVKIIQPLLNRNETRLKNSSTFVDLSKTWTIDPNEVQVSFDVVNLYPSVPIKEAIDIVAEMLKSDLSLGQRTKLSVDDLRQLMELCLSKCYFLWNDKIYLLKNSAPIGLALMVVMAESFLQHHEKNAIETASSQIPLIAPKSFLRYVDDSHARFENIDHARAFQEILNNQDKNIEYTIETENSSSKSLQFLDLDITNNNGQYTFKVHRKNAITNVQLKPNSGHDPKILKGVFTSFLHRAYTVCSQQHQQEEIEFLITNFTGYNGYKKNELVKIANEFRRKRDNPQHSQSEDNDTKQIVVLPWVPGLSPKLRKSFKNAGYKAVFKSSTNLKTLLTSRNKSKLPHLSQPGVYMTTCGCGKAYVGETSMKTRTRSNIFIRNIFIRNNHLYLTKI